MKTLNARLIPVAFVAAGAMFVAAQPSAAEFLLVAATVDKPMTVDGDAADWNGISGTVVPLKGQGNVASVELRAAVSGDTIYILAIWPDAVESRLHKPYKWDDAAQKYSRTKQLEDRIAFSFAMTGDFSPNKLDGSEFTADIWHWKASRSDPAGVAHDKSWRVSASPFPKAKKFTGPGGQAVYLARPSDKGDRLYKPVKYDSRQDDLMPRYKVNLSVQGSIADVRAKGVWRDGYWYLELSRKLDTGNADDAVFPASGSIEMAVAAFSDVDGDKHSTSEKITLQTGALSN